MSAKNCPACGKPLPAVMLEDLGDEAPDEAGDEGHDFEDRLPDGTPSELRRFCPPCRERLKESQ